MSGAFADMTHAPHNVRRLSPRTEEQPRPKILVASGSGSFLDPAVIAVGSKAFFLIGGHRIPHNPHLHSISSGISSGCVTVSTEQLITMSSEEPFRFRFDMPRSEQMAVIYDMRHGIGIFDHTGFKAPLRVVLERARSAALAEVEHRKEIEAPLQKHLDLARDLFDLKRDVATASFHMPKKGQRADAERKLQELE